MVGLSELHSSGHYQDRIGNSSKEGSEEEEEEAEDEEVERNKSKKPKRPCFFCGKFQSRLKRHLETVHAQENAVKEALGLDGKEKIKKFDLLRKEGVYKHNLTMIKENKPIEVERRQNKDQSDLARFKICVSCHAFIDRSYFASHVKNCSKKESSAEKNRLKKSGVPASVLNKHAEGNEDPEFLDIISRFQNDDKGNLCKSHESILTFGRHLFKKNRRRKGKRVETKKSVMQNMRYLAALFIKFKEILNRPTEPEIVDMFCRTNFDALEETIEQLTFDERDGVKNGAKLLYGNVIKRALKVFKGEYLKQGDDEKAKVIDQFEVIFNLQWGSIFGDAEVKSIISRQEKLRTPSDLPIEKDVICVKNFITDELEKLKTIDSQAVDTKIYCRLRNLCVARLTLYNSRRGGEPSRVLVEEWNDALNERWIDPQRVDAYSSEDRNLLRKFKLIYQGGKGNGRLVPNLVPPDVLFALKLLADAEVRKRCSINEKNYFLFPTVTGSLDHVSGPYCTSAITQHAGVSCNLTATKMRHRASTLFANLDIPKHQRAIFYEHMGHSEDINSTVYQCPKAVQEITIVGKYLSGIDGELSGKTPADSHVQQDDVSGSMSCAVGKSRAEKRGLQPESLDHDDCDCSDGEEESYLPRRKEPKLGRSYFKWTDVYHGAVISYFKEPIEDVSQNGTKGSLPGKFEIQKFLQKNPDICKDEKPQKKITIVKTKIFNERTKFRSNYFSTLATMK